MANSKNTTCLNCGAEIDLSFDYCPHCGQSTFKESDLKSFISHFMTDYFTFDSKIFKSLSPLVSRPGFLTLEYLEGKRIQYIPPLRLFIFSSIIFFLLLGLLDTSTDLDSQNIDQEELAWNAFFSSWLPKLFFLFSPLFAVLLGLFFKKRNNSYLVHFLFSLHFHATIFLMGILYVLLSWIFSRMDWIVLNQIILLISLVFLSVYLWKALKNVYQEKAFRLLFKFVFLNLLYTAFILFTVFLLALLTL